MRKFLRKTFLSINLLFALLLLLSYSAPFVNPIHFWPIAFLGVAYLPLLLINLAFSIGWMIRKKWFAMISFGVILLGVNILKSHFGFRTGTPVTEAFATSENLRVLSYNVHLFRAIDQADNNPGMLDDVYELVAETQPDVVCLQEYYTRYRGKYNIARHFADELGLPHQLFHPGAKNDFESYGLAIFSKFPIVASGHLPEFGSGVNSIIFADIQYRDTVVRVYNVHLRSFGFEEEDYQFIRGSSGTIEDDVKSTKKIGARLKKGFQVRSEQAISFRNHLREIESPYLVMGDFNDTPLSFAVHQVKTGLKNAFYEKGKGWGITYNGDFPNFQIDYIMATPDFDVVDFQVIRQKGSDHFPVLADLTWNSD